MFLPESKNNFMEHAQKVSPVGSSPETVQSSDAFTPALIKLTGAGWFNVRELHISPREFQLVLRIINDWLFSGRSFFLSRRNSFQWTRVSSLSKLHDHTQRHHTRTHLDKRSGRHRDLYLTTHNNHNRQTSMPQAGFEPTIPVSERLQTHALDRAATGIGCGYAFT